MNNIRNFAIISHIDHGKSTLADRLLELTNTITAREMKNRLLDSMELEQEKGITIKLKTVRMQYTLNSQSSILNLIDTPGHVDFSYEVSRALAACEGALLLVDATQGVQAQTLSVLKKAQDLNLTIIPVINKVDIVPKGPQLEQLEREMRNLLSGYVGEVSHVSAKTGEGVPGLLERIIKEIPNPHSAAVKTPFNVRTPAFSVSNTPRANKPALQHIYSEQTPRALIFDSFFNPYKGVIALVRIFDGEFTIDSLMKTLGTKQEFEPLELGYLTPKMQKQQKLSIGEVGYIATGLKDISLVTVGDTIVSAETQDAMTRISDSTKPLPGYKKPLPMVFLSFYPKDASKFKDLKEALDELSLVDSALDIKTESSPALGAGFRVGFLGILHAEIISERIKRDYEIELITTVPSVTYEIIYKRGKTEKITSAADFPDTAEVAEVREPTVIAQIFTPSKYIGGVSELISTSRGEFSQTKYLSEQNILIEAKIPLSELIVDFFDNLKSISSGFASLDYELFGFEKEDIVKLTILVHGTEVHALARLVPKSKAYEVAKNLVEKLKDNLPRQQFKIALQAAIGAKIIARETLPAYRKDVTAKLYGGDPTRRDKLLKKQVKGKARMEQIGKVNIPTEVIFKLMRTS